MPRWRTTKTVSRNLNVPDYVLRDWLRRELVPGAGKLPSGEWRLPPDAEKHLLRLAAGERASRDTV